MRPARPPALLRALGHRAFGCLLLALAAWAGSAWIDVASAQPAPIRLKIVGGLADISQYIQHEAPFWTVRVPQLTAGVVQAEIAPFDRSGIRAQDLPRLLRLGVVSFANVLLGVAAADDPELDAMDLPLLNPDLASLRQSATLWRPHLTAMLRNRYGVELLAIYTYPAQVVLCRGPYGGLDDLRGRRVRTSSVAQAELMTALGAVPVVIPFAETVPAMRDGVVHCAITGALSANTIGLAAVATHLTAQPINWGVSVFVANIAAWQSLPETVRTRLREGLTRLQEDIWLAAEQANVEGIDCNIGRRDCPTARPGRMLLVDEPMRETERRRLLNEVVLPGWVRRCGQDCAEAWNRTMAPGLGLRLGSE